MGVPKVHFENFEFDTLRKCTTEQSEYPTPTHISTEHIQKDCTLYHIQLFFLQFCLHKNKSLLTKLKQKCKYYIHWIIIYNNAMRSLVLIPVSISINQRHCKQNQDQEHIVFHESRLKLHSYKTTLVRKVQVRRNLCTYHYFNFQKPYR